MEHTVAQVSVQIGVGDFCALKSNSSLRGTVGRAWHDTDEDPIINNFRVRKDLPDHYRQQLKRTGLLPKYFVVLNVISPRVGILVHTNDLVLIDRYFSRGDVVKRNPLDAQSGTVIGTTCSCTLRPYASIRESQSGEAVSGVFALGDTQTITNVETHMLEPYLPWNIGNTIFFEDWVGTIKDVSHTVTVQLEDNSIVCVDNAEDVEEIGLSFPPGFEYVKLNSKSKVRDESDSSIICYPGQNVRIKKWVLLKSRWLSGTFNAAIKPKGVVLDVRCTDIDVHWRMPRSDTQEVKVASKPVRWLSGRLLETGDIKSYDISRSPESPRGVEDPFSGVINMVASDYVILRCNEGEKSSHASIAGDIRHKDLFGPNTSTRLVAQITSTTSRVKVQWQDNSISDELSSGICSYNEVDHYDVWPGEIVSLKGPEAVQQDSAFEKMLRTRSVGVVQSVNAVERIASIRWFKMSDITITGEDYSVLVRPHSKLGKITGEITESSLYEIGSYQALAKRRGDLVRLERPHRTAGQSGINWFGEVVDLLPNGLLLVRLGSLDKVRDLKCSVLDVTVVVSADDDTTENDSFETESSDEWKPMTGQWPVSTSIEYEGSTPSDTSMNDEEQWETDSDDDASNEDGAKSEKYKGRQLAPPADSDPRPQHNSDETSMDIDGSNDPSLEEVDSQQKPAASTSISSPPAFEILEGSAPKQASPLGPGNHTKEWLRAVSREHKILRTSLPEGVYVRTWESNIELLRVLIVGSSGTPYAHAPFLFDITLHKRFPTEAPTAFFHSWSNGVGKVNPNLYEDGKVCLSLLGTWRGDDDGEEWVAGKSTVLQIIVSLLGLVLVKEPFYSKMTRFPSPGVLFDTVNTKHSVAFSLPSSVVEPVLLAVHNEAGFEALQDTTISNPTSAVYSERAFVLSRGFVTKALQSLPAGCESIIEWLYLPSRNGPSLLRIVVQDCQRFLQQDSHASMAEEEANTQQRLNLERYHIDSWKLTKGILILLRKIVPDLEDRLRYEERLVAEAQ
ncbi:MAG: hypothetical protein Q9171_004031 [Xanthocarpia ochracea]